MVKIEINLTRRHLYVIIAVLTAFALSVPTAGWAADRFKDVSDSNVFHEDIAWLAEVGVTRGCNPPANDEFCPGENVRREAMAAFLHRLAMNGSVSAGNILDLECQVAICDRYGDGYPAPTAVPRSYEQIVQASQVLAWSYNEKVHTLEPGDSIAVSMGCHLEVGPDTLDGGAWTDAESGVVLVSSGFGDPTVREPESNPSWETSGLYWEAVWRNDADTAITATFRSWAGCHTPEIFEWDAS
jgi:hypothetical protein